MALKQAVLISVLLFLSAFASSSETAFFSFNRFQLRRLKERYKPAYLRIRTLLAHPSRLLILILLINEIVNVSLSSLITSGLKGHVQSTPWLRALTQGETNPNLEWLLITLGVMCITLPLLLVVGEITPKLVAAKMNRVVGIVNSYPLIVLYRVLLPILWVFDSAISTVLRKFKAEGRDHLSKTMTVLSEEDFLVLMEEGHKEGTVEPSERKLITKVFEFDDSTAGEVMTPIHQAFMISASARVAEVLPDLNAQKYSRVPVYHKSRKHIIGVLYIKDLLALRDAPELADTEVRALMSKVMFVSARTRLSLLFRRFKENKTHMAIVVRDASDDEDDNEALGVVTMEDALESIFGDIEDERDNE